MKLYTHVMCRLLFLYFRSSQGVKLYDQHVFFPTIHSFTHSLTHITSKFMLHVCVVVGENSRQNQDKHFTCHTFKSDRTYPFIIPLELKL